MTAFKLQQQLNRKWKTALVSFKYIFGGHGYTSSRTRTQNPDETMAVSGEREESQYVKKWKRFILFTEHFTPLSQPQLEQKQVKSSPHFTFAVCSFFLFIVEIPLLSLLEAAFVFWWKQRRDSLKVGKLLTNLSDSTAISRVKKLKIFHGRPCLVLFISNRRCSFLLCFS